MKNRKITALILFAVFAATLFSTAAYAAYPEKAITAEEMTHHNDEWGFEHKDGVVLALCGGGTKGLAHIGILEVLKRENIPVAGIVGTSMGAIIGGLYATGWTPEELRENVPKFNLMEVISGRRNKAFGFESTSYEPRNGERLFSTAFGDNEIFAKKAVLNSKDLYKLLSELTSRVAETDFDKFPTPFAAIATDLESGESVELRSGNLASALRASMSLPAVFEPWERDGRLLVDGGLKANLPVILAKKMFPGHPVIALNLSPMSIEGKSGKMKSMVNVAMQSLEILMHDQIIENCNAADLVIQVDCKGLGTLDSDGYDDIMNRGVKAAEEKLPELKKLVNGYHNYIPAAMHTGPEKQPELYVKEVVIKGVPKNLNKQFQSKYQPWVDKPLDMKEVARAVKELSIRAEIKSVEPKIDNLSKDTVRVTLDVEQPPKLELGISGYTSNLNSDRWLSIGAITHNLLMDGDTADLELRGGTNWAIMGRYFSALTKNNWQFGLSAAITNETTPTLGSYMGNEGLTEFSEVVPESFKRISGKAMIYKNLAHDKVRLGVGYAFGKTDYSGVFFEDNGSGTMESYPEEDPGTKKGIAASVGINTMDDPVVPTKGFALMSDLWFPHGETLFSRTELMAKLPLKNHWNISLSGGLHTANWNRESQLPPYYAQLGTRNELWILAREPLFGDQAYWVKLGASKVLMKSWWGGINTEIFATYGATRDDWGERVANAWEAGVQFGIPTNFLPGSIILAYGQVRSSTGIYDYDKQHDRNEFIIGYTLGIPKWWKGPLP